MTIRIGLSVLVLMIGLGSTTSVHPAAGLTVTGLPPSEACLQGAQSWKFDAKWNAFVVPGDGKLWPKYIVAASSCVGNTPVTCTGAQCSYTVTCGSKVGRTAVHVIPTAVVDATGKAIRTSSTVVGGASKPTKACK